MYAMTQQEAEDDSGTMSGMLSVCDVPAFTLFDTGATHSFMSAKFHAIVGQKKEHVDEPLEISLPSGKTIVTDSMVKNVGVDIGGKDFSADLYVLNMKDFDVILGMDWLSKHRASIKCQEREITLKLPEDKEIKYYGTKTKTVPRVVSAMKALKMMKKGNCQGYLVSMVGAPTPELTPADVPIVQEFLDVFPEDLPGIPPSRQVEFIIDLEPGAAPVSKAPYRMAPKELQELKMQIQELLDLKFIRPSVSPWGAPVLFIRRRTGQ